MYISSSGSNGARIIGVVGVLTVVIFIFVAVLVAGLLLVLIGTRGRH